MVGAFSPPIQFPIGGSSNDEQQVAAVVSNESAYQPNGQATLAEQRTSSHHE